MAETTKLPPIFKPTPEEEEARQKTYSKISEMRDLKNDPQPHFAGPRGNRSWLDYIDDSERVLNGYQMSREAQGKEDWQANLMDNITLAKCRAIAAGVGLKVPEMHFEATNKDGLRDLKRAEIFKNITRQTYVDGNPMLHAFLEVWQMIAHGVVFVYEGYQTGGAKMRRVKSFDSLTGKIEVEEEFVQFEGKPISIILNPQDFYWWDFKIRDLQDQKRVAWAQIYGRRDLESEFSKYKNYRFVRDKAEASQLIDQDTLYYDKWKDNVQDSDEYEVLRLYDKEEDLYEVWVNGVPLIRSPLLWGDHEKIYPFAKQINQSFANSNFFVGMSWPAILESYQDHKNTQINTLIDKTYRSMEPPMLVGLQNKDLFDVESQLVNQDNRYYVPDVNAVKPYPIDGVNQGELAMLNVLNEGIELMSVDRSQQGISPGVQKTARQALIDDARAQELKGPLFLALEDLWFQKTKVRNGVILSHFLKDKASQEDKKDQIVSINDYVFSDGKRGILDIHIAKTPSKLFTQQEIESREEAMEQQGQPYKLISVTQNYLNDYMIDFKIVPQSFHSQSKLAQEEELMSEIQSVGVLDPAFLAANKDQYVDRILELRGRHREQYNEPQPVEQPQAEGLLGLEQIENVTPTANNTGAQGGVPVPGV